ncbi:hypothetical protein D9M72_483070 [compost metagenome]
MAGQVERHHGVRVGQGIEVEQPVVQVSAKSVDEEHGFGAATLAGIADPDAVDVGKLVRGSGVFFASIVRRRFISRDIVIDLRIAHLRRCQHAQQRLHRQHVAGLRHLAAQRARVGRLHRIGNLVGFHVEDRQAHGNLGAFVDQPRIDRAFLHRQAPLGHHDRDNRGGNCGCHQCLPPFMVLRAAATICAALGM